MGVSNELLNLIYRFITYKLQMEAQFIGYGIAKGLSDAGFWIGISMLIVLAPILWRAPPERLQVLKALPKYPPANITAEAVSQLIGYPSDWNLYDSSPTAPLKQFWATNLRNLIEGKILEKRGDIHFLFNQVRSLNAAFTEELPVFLCSVLCNDGWEETIYITVDELERVLPCLSDMDWRKIVHVGNLGKLLIDLGPIIKYEETLRRLS